MPDYSKSKIYTIRNRNDDSLIYVGATVQPLSVRFGGHKSNSKAKTSIKQYIDTNFSGDWSNGILNCMKTFRVILKKN